MTEHAPASGNRLVALARGHPILCAVFVVCTALGTLLGALYLPGEWTLLRRLAAGAVAGAGTGLLFTFTKIYE